METTLFNPDLKELLSQIAEREVDPFGISPMELFMANLTNLLLGVAFADGKVTIEEKQHLKTTLTRLNLLQGEVGKLTQLMVNGISKQKSFNSLKNFLTLAEPLTKSQRLLLIGLGYEMSAADGSIDPKELTYLQRIATALNLEPQHLNVFIASFSYQRSPDIVVLEEVRYLLDPARFHELDIVFTEAANTLVASLPQPVEPKPVIEHIGNAYTDLDRFQQTRNQLDQIYVSIDQVIQECIAENYVTETLAQDFGQAWERLRSQQFRIAVVGEFSQGKSTFLNALLGKKIQPSRATPCSGTLTVLRYGEQKRVVCRYRDGQEEEIPVEQYQEKAAISKEAAHGKESVSQALLENSIEEIIFEHPDLELCKSGVEIIDSPGLNEHDDRTRVTQQLLKGTDAVIFLANASRPLTKWEQDFLTYDLRQQMRSIHAEERTFNETELQEDTPAENLFVLVNFMDLLDEESDREDIRERFQNFLMGEKSILVGENRIHYISAKATLKAAQEEQENEYTKSFQQFVQTLEKFLANERGSIKLNKAVKNISDIITGINSQLELKKRELNGEVHLSEQNIQEIRFGIRDAKAISQSIVTAARQFYTQIGNEAVASWEQGLDDMIKQVINRSQYWECGNTNDPKQISRRYIDCFVRTLSEEVDGWIQNSLTEIMKGRVEDLNREIITSLTTIQAKFQNIDQKIGSNFSQQIELSLSSNQKNKFKFFLNLDKNDGEGWLVGFGIGGIAAGLIGILSGGFLLPVALMAFGGGMLGFLGGNDKKQELRQQVIQKGFEKFDEALPKIFEELDQRISAVLQERVDAAQKIIASTLDSAQNLLNETKGLQQQSTDQRQQKVADIQQKVAILLQASQQANSLLSEQLLVEINRTLSNDPRNPEFWLRQGATLLKLGRYEEALAAYEQAIAFNQESITAWNGKGDALVYLQRFEEALIAYNRVLADASDHDEALASKGYVLHRLRQFQEATEVLEKAVSLNTANPNLWLLWLFQADSLLELGHYEKSTLVCDHLIEIKPDLGQAWWMKATALYFSNKPDAGLVAVEKAIELDPSAAKAWFIKGNILTYAFGKYEEGLWAFERSISLDPQDPRVWRGRGYALVFLNQVDDALESYEKAISITPDFLDAWIDKGDIFLYLIKQPQKALINYEQAISLNSASPLIWYKKGLALVALEQHKEALEAYDHAIQLNQQDANFWKEKGNTLYIVGNYKDAIDAYERAIQINPSHARAWGGKGNALMAWEKSEEAIVAYDQAIAIDPKLPLTWSCKGDALRRLRRDQEALNAYEQAISLDQENPNCWYNAACALLNLRSYERALANCEQAIQLNSEIEAFWELRSDLLSRLGRHDEAMQR